MPTRRIGVVADIHSHAPGAADLPEAVLQAFEGCDLILTLGDAGESAVLDRLQTCAPVQGTRGKDDPAADSRLTAGTRCFEFDSQVVGAVFDLASADQGIATDPQLQLPARPASSLMAQVFGRAVHVVAYAATHRAAIAQHDGVLFVNPGSPTLSDEPSVAVLELEGAKAHARIVPITAPRERR